MWIKYPTCPCYSMFITRTPCCGPNKWRTSCAGDFCSSLHQDMLWCRRNFLHPGVKSSWLQDGEKGYGKPTSYGRWSTYIYIYSAIINHLAWKTPWFADADALVISIVCISLWSTLLWGISCQFCMVGKQTQNILQHLCCLGCPPYITRGSQTLSPFGPWFEGWGTDCEFDKASICWIGIWICLDLYILEMKYVKELVL